MDEDTAPKPTPEQFEALPESVKKYILVLERKLAVQNQALHRNEDELQRKRYVYWKR